MPDSQSIQVVLQNARLNRLASSPPISTTASTLRTCASSSIAPYVQPAISTPLSTTSSIYSPLPLPPRLLLLVGHSSLNPQATGPSTQSPNSTSKTIHSLSLSLTPPTTSTSCATASPNSNSRYITTSTALQFVHRTTNCSAIYLIGIAVGIAISTIVIATHALAAIVMAPFFAFLPKDFVKKQLAHIAHIAAAKGTYILNNDFDTVDRLVARLHAAVESDKLLIKLGLERGRNRYLIQEVMKQLRKNHTNFRHQLNDLEEHVCLCSTTVNRARSLLLQEIYLHQTHNS